MAGRWPTYWSDLRVNNSLRGLFWSIVGIRSNMKEATLWYVLVSNFSTEKKFQFVSKIYFWKILLILKILHASNINNMLSLHNIIILLVTWY